MNERLIPAHAGKTRCRGHRVLGCGAHPRSRGENMSDKTGQARFQGSSPLTRGKLRGNACRHAAVRLIPAHAGKTPSPDTPGGRHAAHPRSRGENASRAFQISTSAGSSPLTRGKPRGYCPAASARGLIPAHAGKTTPTR